MWPFSNSNLTTIVEAKRSQRAKALADVPKDISPEQAGFLKATATEIVARIEQGEWTATQVLDAYIARANYAQAKTNCLTEVMLGPARQRAAELDADFAATKKLRGPLHGVPMSVKEQFDVTGYDTSIGFSQWTNKPAKKDADLVHTLQAAGAIIYVKTNIPQTMLAFECSNPVWGRTINPWNENYTCGGSSGGEAALLAMDGSAAGIGSDVGGSVRIPAAYCGIYSLKPATGRVAYGGAQSPAPGSEGVLSVAGPMGRSVQDLELISRALFGVAGDDSSIPPLPFREVTLPTKLKFGYYTSDNYIKASPACKRAVLETVEALRNAGHECVEFEIPDSHVPFDIFAAINSADGYQTMLSHLGPDPKESALFLLTLGPKIPSVVRVFVAWIVEKVAGDKLFANTIRAARKKSTFEMYKFINEKNQYKNRFNSEVWSRYEFDSIIAPVQALPVAPHGACDNFVALAESTILYNVLDLPVGCLPVTRVDPVKDQLTDEWVSGPGLGSRLIESGLYRGKKPLYDPVAMKGMPVNIQLVGKKWEDEKVLAVMKVVDDALGRGRSFGPGAWDAYTGNKA